VSALRPYQIEALDALSSFYAAGGRRGGIGLPTGVGKTHVMAHQGRRAVADEWPASLAHLRGRAALYVLHRDTLVEQTEQKLRATLPTGTSIGVVKGHRNEVGARVLVASVHSLRPGRLDTLPRIGLCVVDEAHVSVSPTYRRLYDHPAVAAFAPGGAVLAGYTATWLRQADGALGDVWQDVVYRRSVRWAVRCGHLVPPRGVRIGDGADTDGVRINRATKDFSDADLERVVMLTEIAEAVVRAAREHGPDRPTVLFAPTVAAAEFFADALRATGVTCEGIYGTTGPAERRERFARHREGITRVLTTCTALAEGWDAPYVSRGILCRPTRSPGLFTQMVGRLLRPWPGKSDALLLDCVGSTAEVTLRTAVDLSCSRETGDGDLEPDYLPEVDLDDEGEKDGAPERTAVLARRDRPVDLFAGTNVTWLTDPHGVPFVPCGDVLVFLVEDGVESWAVGEAWKRLGPDGRPVGGFVARGLSSEDAIELAADHAETRGAGLARKGSSWRRGAPSEAQVMMARGMGIAVEGLNRGQVSDAISISYTLPVLRHLARWSEARKVST
jgi:superfamily II DNA or RNA helicase